MTTETSNARGGDYRPVASGNAPHCPTCECPEQVSLAAAPPPAAARGDMRGLEGELRKLCSWKHLMSYNEAYFGEPEGELKSVVYAIERHLPSLAADGVQAGEVTQRAEELANMAVTAFISSDLGRWLAALRAIASALSQQPEARGVVDRWKPSSVEPPHNPKKDSLGTEYLIYPPTSGGDRTAFYGRRLGGAACWYRYGAQVHGVDYWQELPASPAALTGERNGC
jgi:hypothetical protein